MAITLWDHCKSILRQEVGREPYNPDGAFDFRLGLLTEELYQSAHVAVAEDLFAMPYDVTYYEWDMMSTLRVGAYILDFHRLRDGDLKLVPPDDRRLSVHLTTHGKVAIRWIVMIDPDGVDKERVSIDFPLGDVVDDTLFGVASMATRDILALTMAIGAGGVKQVTESPSRSVAKKYEKRGELPPLTHKVLSIDTDALRGKSFGTPLGTHASPRLHWRRGHVRSLPNGGKTMVRPHLVGSVTNGIVEKTYSVQ